VGKYVIQVTAQKQFHSVVESKQNITSCCIVKLYASNEMNYRYTKLAMDWKEEKVNSFRVRLVYAILFFIPRANEDNEKLYPKVAKWLLEINENGIPYREIGIDINGNPLFTAPNDRNYGLWTDSDNTFEIKELELSNHEEFESMWQKALQNA